MGSRTQNKHNLNAHPHQGQITLHKAVPDVTDILSDSEGSSRVSGLLICGAVSTAHDGGPHGKSVYI